MHYVVFDGRQGQISTKVLEQGIYKNETFLINSHVSQQFVAYSYQR